jgi:hypothetical protein
VSERVQLSRAKGWRLPDGAVSVARPGRWGNPFKVGEALTRAEAVRCFAAMLAQDATEVRPAWLPAYPSNAAIRAELAGRSLACWCPLPAAGEDDVCHAAVLLAVANEEAPRG